MCNALTKVSEFGDYCSRIGGGAENGSWVLFLCVFRGADIQLISTLYMPSRAGMACEGPIQLVGEDL